MKEHKKLKAMLNKKNKLYKNFKKHGYRYEDKLRLDNFREECKEAVENKEIIYLTNLGNKLSSIVGNRNKPSWQESDAR